MANKWKKIPDEQVRHVWRCKSSHCESKVTVYVDPSFYAEAGTPVCVECDGDMTYIRTEIKEG